MIEVCLDISTDTKVYWLIYQNHNILYDISSDISINFENKKMKNFEIY